jgi:hypothetical protein
MALFDAYVMVDWSASNRRCSGRSNCIWIAHGSATADEPNTVSSPSRTEAEQIMRAQLQPIVSANKGCVLLCADFGYGYPAGFASLLSESVPGETTPWRIVWQYLSKHIQDDVGSKSDRQPTNRNNRFQVANTINNAVPGKTFAGPFWCQFTAVHTVTFLRNSPRSVSSVRADQFLRFVSRIGGRRVILRSVSSAMAAWAAKCSRAFHASTAFDSILSLPDVPLYGPSRPDGRPRANHGLIHSSEFAMRKPIRASKAPVRTPSRTGTKCAQCGTGRAISTEVTYSQRNSRFLSASKADQQKIISSAAKRAGFWVARVEIAVCKCVIARPGPGFSQLC